MISYTASGRAEISKTKIVNRKLWEGSRVRSRALGCRVARKGIVFACLVEGRVIRVASAASIVAQDCEWETPSSLAPTLQSLASVTQVRNPAGSSSKWAVKQVCRGLWLETKGRLEEETIRPWINYPGPAHTLPRTEPPSLITDSIDPPHSVPTNLNTVWMENILSVQLALFHLLIFS